MTVYKGCPRCLIHINAMMMIRARWIDTDDEQRLLHFEEPDSLDPESLAFWYFRLMEKSAGDVVFDINDQRGGFKPITTWNGDPICVIHLWEVRQKELEPWRRNKLCGWPIPQFTVG